MDTSRLDGVTAPPHDGTRSITHRFSLYTDVKENMNEWNLLQFAAIVAGMEDMTAAMDNFALRCKKMPGRYQCPKFKSCFNLGSLAV